jgi:hypothetical protein
VKAIPNSILLESLIRAEWMMLQGIRRDLLSRPTGALRLCTRRDIQALRVMRVEILRLLRKTAQPAITFRPIVPGGDR